HPGDETVTPPVHASVMCDICNGKTIDELRQRRTEAIDTYGWAVQYVEGSHCSSPWAYTIGLVESFAHPELVVTSTDFKDALTVLNSLGDLVRQGERLSPGRPVHAAG